MASNRGIKPLLVEGFHLDAPHRTGCWTEGDDRRFMVHDGTDWNRAINGRKGGSTAWHRFRCNDPDCDAVMLVRYDVLSKWIEAESGF